MLTRLVNVRRVKQWDIVVVVVVVVAVAVAVEAVAALLF